MELQTLPIGEQSFVKLRTKNRLYVDKTEYIYRMIQNGTYYFLSRPRRFGKSLLLNTIEAFFQGKKELFNGLYIASKEHDWFVHPVLHLDFSSMIEASEENLFRIINDFLDEQETLYGGKEGETDIALRFKWVIRNAYEKTQQPVVILVDEYDKPLLEAIGNPNLQDKYRTTLRGFYSILKMMDTYIGFALLTGITKFSKVSIFSDLNNLNDISRDEEYASICGLTDDEVDRDLVPYIQNFAQKKRKSYDEIRNQLRRMYDGYHFVENSVGLYNPYSVMNALSKKKLDRYWFSSGTPTMLVELLKKKKYSLPSLEDPVGAMSLDNKTGNNDSIVPLLYQSGYLSIKRMSVDGNYYWLEFPNDEVRAGFFGFLLPYYTSVSDVTSESEVGKLVADMREGNVEQMMKRLESFYAGIPYEVEIGSESDFRNAMYILYKLLGEQVDAEYQTSDGRIDLLLHTDKFIYIIECKIDSTADVALAQIKEKEYALPWALDKREKVLIGINFSTEKRRPDDWIIERGDGTIVKRGDQVGEQVGEQVSGGSKLAVSWQQVGSKLAASRDMPIEAVAQQMRKYVIACGAKEICADFGFRDVYKFRRDYINPLVATGFLAMTQPDAPQSSKQKYLLSPKGLALLAELTKE